jgi:acyl-CoA thioesterase-2
MEKVTSDGASGLVPQLADGTELSSRLAVERVDEFVYRSVFVNDAASLYGGQLIGQALVACGGTVPAGRVPHSLHAYFLQPGDPGVPVLYRIRNERDGRSFSSRRVTAFQHDAAVFTMTASFDSGIATDADEDVRTAKVRDTSAGCREVSTPLPLEITADEWDLRERTLPVRFLVRPRGLLTPGDPLLHSAALAFMSDFSSGLQRNRSGLALGPSLDHALWFHRSVNWNDWLYVDLSPGHVYGRRGWYQGSITDRAGTRVASLAQEMLYRRSNRN